MKKIIFIFGLIALLSSSVPVVCAFDVQVFPSPDGKLIAKIITAEKSPECKVQILTDKGALLVSADYSSADGEHGQYVEKASWTPDSQFFVYSTYNTGGHAVWQSVYFFYRRRDNKILPSYNFLPPIVDGKFSLQPPDIISVTIWSPFRPNKGIVGSIKLPVTFKLSDLNEGTREE
jgi:hypothetical protein